MSTERVDEELVKMLKILEELKKMCKTVNNVAESIKANEKKDPSSEPGVS